MSLNSILYTKFCFIVALTFFCKSRKIVLDATWCNDLRKATSTFDVASKSMQ